MVYIQGNRVALYRYAQKQKVFHSNNSKQILITIEQKVHYLSYLENGRFG